MPFRCMAVSYTHLDVYKRQSSGSACASNHPAISGVLKGIGAGKEYLDATIRFSMSEFTTREEIDYTLETLYNCVPMLRRYTRH